MVQEFLEFFQLDYTGAVFEPESGMVNDFKTVNYYKLSLILSLPSSNYPLEIIILILVYYFQYD